MDSPRSVLLRACPEIDWNVKKCYDFAFSWYRVKEDGVATHAKDELSQRSYGRAMADDPAAVAQTGEAGPKTD